MNTKILSSLVFLVFLFGQALLLGQKPVQDTDYQFTYTTDEETDSYLILSYYLENLSSENIMFFNFVYNTALDGQEIVQSLPEDVLVLKPGEKLPFLKFKTYSTSLSVNWVTDFMRHSDDEVQSILNRDYLYYYEYSGTEEEVSYTYCLKNISDRGIMFYDFTRSEVTSYTHILDDIPVSMFALRPGQSRPFLRYDVKVGESTLTTNWFAMFIEENHDSYYSFSISEYDFCSGIYSLLRSAAKDFADIKGPNMPDSDDFFGLSETWYSKTHIKGLNEEEISLVITHDYSGNIGPSASLYTIKAKLEDYREILKDCLPDGWTETIVAEEDLLYSEATVKYEGVFEGNDHSVTLNIQEDYNNDEMYFLELMIEEPSIF